MHHIVEKITPSKRIERLGPAHTGHFRGKVSGEVPDGMSYRDIGKALGLSYTHVALIEKQALAKVKARLIKALAEEGIVL